MSAEPSVKNPDSLSRIVMLTFGHMEQGGSYWCYVAIKPSRYDAFRAAMYSMTYNIQNFDKDEFGEIIVSGHGDRPPRDVTQKVAKMFDIQIRDLFKDEQPDKTVAKHFLMLQEEANHQ